MRDRRKNGGHNAYTSKTYSNILVYSNRTVPYSKSIYTLYYTVIEKKLNYNKYKLLLIIITVIFKNIKRM